MRGLTVKQRDTLQRIESVRDLHAKQIASDVAAGRFPPNTTASPWVSVVTLRTVHHQRRSDIEALIKKGYLYERSTDGWGPEVKVVNRTY